MRAISLIVLATFLASAAPLAAEEVRAFWVSPDWLLPGNRRVSHEEARGIADRVVRAVKAQGGNTIFLETLMRGQLIGPCARITRAGHVSPDGMPPLLRAFGASGTAGLLGAPGPVRPAHAPDTEATVDAMPPSAASRAAGERAMQGSDWIAAARAKLAASRSGVRPADYDVSAAARDAATATVSPSRIAPVTRPSATTSAPLATPAVAVRAAPAPAAPPVAAVRLTPGGVDALPVYPLCQWDYVVVDGWPQDLLSLFIESGRHHGVAIHAWVHCFYWKSDNESFRKPWQDGPSLWDDLMVDYLQRASKAVRFMPRQRALAYLASEMAKGFTWDRFTAALNKWGAGGFEGRFQGLIQSIVGAEGPAPDFLLTNIRGDLHYPMEMDRILALYLNPGDRRVTERLERVTQQIVASHPGLAGVHLDHVRYQKWPYGGPNQLAGFPKELRISYWDIPRASVASVWPQMMAQREAAITAMVKTIRGAMPSGMKLSAAVYPTYYASRDSGASISSEAYICQDWARWPVDYVVPMIYNPSAPYVQKALGLCRSGGAARANGRCPPVYPGVSSLGMAKNWRSWAFFDFQGLAGMVPGIPGSAMKTMGLKDKLL